MTAPPFVHQLFGRRANGKPNIADSASSTSVAIADHIFDQLGIEGVEEAKYMGQTAGSFLEIAVRDLLVETLPVQSPLQPLEILHGGRITAFRQYEHLATLMQLVEEDETGTLFVEVGRDYEIRPDVTVGLHLDDGRAPLLHAAVSCKLTLRSDRAQNVRHEAVIMNRHRRGRQPHIVAVTAEPLPTRIASLARGTGELDAVYHVALDELFTATMEVGTGEQRRVLAELMNQYRVLDLESLPEALAV